MYTSYPFGSKVYELEIGNFGICAYRMVDCELLMIDLHIYIYTVSCQHRALLMGIAWWVRMERYAITFGSSILCRT